ncbi:MAG: phosphatidylglycerophosphatase A [Candidatus Babeliaceae bacterium]
MSKIYQQLATLGPIGFLPACGTLSSLITVPFAWLLKQFYPSKNAPITEFFLILFITILAFFIINKAKNDFPEKDPKPIVLDEVVGCLWALWALPFTFFNIGITFFLFRFFDITKIGIWFCEKLPGTWGIMADDIAAAVLARIVFFLICFFL